MSNVMLIDDFYDDSDFEDNTLSDDADICYLCSVCDGSGEGMRDGTSCPMCKGKGEING